MGGFESDGARKAQPAGQTKRESMGDSGTWVNGPGASLGLAGGGPPGEAGLVAVTSVGAASAAIALGSVGMMENAIAAKAAPTGAGRGESADRHIRGLE